MPPEVTVLLKQLTQSLSTLGENLEDLAVIIHQEHDAMAHHDLPALEEVLVAKDACVEKTLAHFEALKKISENLAPASTEQAESLNLSKLLDWAKSLNQRYPHQDLTEFEKRVEATRQRFHTLKNKIEGNRRVLDRLLAHHESSCQFWAQLHAEVLAYDAKGMRKPPSEDVFFRIRA